MKKLISTFILIIIYLHLFTQINDSIYFNQKVDSVVVLAPTINYRYKIFEEAVYEINVNEGFSFNSLDKILDKNTKLSIKKYGEGQISTVSVKGFNSSHTDFLWNGVKLNSPMLGQADLSLISIGNNTNLKLSENNNDNISGEVSLNNKVDFYKYENEFKLLSSLSSFGDFKQAFSYEFALKEKFYNNSNFSVNYNLNKYKYINKSLSRNKEIYLDNGEIKIINLEQINAFKINERNTLKTFIKVFFADRNIAPTIYESSSSKNQKDNLYLGKIEWENTSFNKSKYQIKINTSFIHQKLKYKLSTYSNVILNKSNSIQSNIYFKKTINGNTYFSTLVNNEIENGVSNNYSKSIWRNKLKINPELFFKIKTKLSSQFNLKFAITELLVNTKLSQPLPSISISYLDKYLPSSILLEMKYSRKVKFPSLNDLYWNPGGNLDLKEEYAHSLNFIFALERYIKLKKNNKFYFQNNFELFNIFSENYIQWQPTNNTFWQPINLGNVYSRGFTNDFTIKYISSKDFSLHNSLSYNFTRITKTKQTEQLIYVPMTNIYNSTKLKTKWVDIIVNQQYISEKFVNYTNTSSIEKYYLLDFVLAKEFTLRNENELQLIFEVNNILDKTYYTYINRSLPKRNFFLKVEYSLNIKNLKK